MIEDFEHCYRALESRDPRFDGWFVVAVTSTGVYCRPSCPAATPKRANVRFYPTAAAAGAAGFRPCLRCRPSAAPGSPEWDTRADLAGRAMRLIADGVVDREGVAGLARRVAYSPRHLHRQLVAELGAGPRALARTQRAGTARLLIETTAMPFTEVAFAAGFSTLRQFNATVRDVFGRSPTELRRRGRVRAEPATPGLISVWLPYRKPFHWGGLIDFLDARAIPGVEEVTAAGYRRTLLLPRGRGVIELRFDGRELRGIFRLTDLRDLPVAVERSRRLFDLDSDPVAIDSLLSADGLLGPLVREAPGRRVPGAADGTELALRAVLGQQVSVARARALARSIVFELGEPLPEPDGELTHLFPTAAALAGAPPIALPMPARRQRTLRALARRVAAGELCLDPSADRSDARQKLLAIPGVGDWTASYIAMRALRDPDVFLVDDLGVRRALQGLSARLADVPRLTERWRPWRSYATQHLWSSLRATRRRAARRDRVAVPGGVA